MRSFVHICFLSFMVLRLRNKQAPPIQSMPRRKVFKLHNKITPIASK